jgi:serine/threonine protein kinase
VVSRGAVDDGRLDEILETHYMHAPVLRADDFEEFIRDRSRRLLDAIEEVTGKPIAGRDADAVVEAFGAPLTWSDGQLKEEVPKVILYGKYEVIREITTGGMSTVLHARDLETKADVCLKRVPVRGHEADALMREMSIYDRLTRREFAHSLEVHGVERDDTSIALVTAWADGGTLEEYVESQPHRRLEPPEARDIALALHQAIAELHALDVVHRDIKPSNVLHHAGGWKLADFGIAKNTSREMTRATMQHRYTPGYAPPEQVDGARANPSADVYAVGKVIAFMLTGETDPDRIPYPSWRTLVRNCNALNSSERPSVEAVGKMLADLPS